MLYKDFNGIKLSALGMGGMRYPVIDGDDSRPDEKKTFELIPLCHNIPIESIKIEFDNNKKDELYIYSFAKCTYKTGIEMEALTAASVAALTVYDMCKAIDRGMVIEEIKLIEKTGGKSGDFHND